MPQESITRVKDWKPARHFPETYPGDRPDTSYMILDDHVLPLHFEDPDDLDGGYIVEADGRHTPADRLLAQLRLPVLADRYSILAYGANRNPGTIGIKLHNYEYRSPGKGLAVPVLRGKLLGADVVAGGLSGQGYLYGDLLVQSEFTTNTRIEAWLTLLDDDQLRAINDSEGINRGAYAMAQFPGFTVDGSDRELAPLGYAGNRPVFVSPRLGKPLSFATIDAVNRSLPAMTPLEMFDHLMDVFDTRQVVREYTGIDEDEKMSAELAKYLNGQWWYHFTTGDNPIRGYRRVVALFDDLIKTHSEPVSTADLKRKQGLLLPVKVAYQPGKSMTLNGLIS